MFYVAAQIWFELLLAFVAGGLTMWWWQRAQDASGEALSTPAQEPASLPAPTPQIGEQDRADAPPRRPRPAQPSLPPSLVALAEDADPEPEAEDAPPQPPTATDGAAAPAAEAEPPPMRDDLTRIRGVGPVLQRKLHDLGVFSLAEIASWTQEDVERVQSHLSGFSDRVRRDRWVDQARALVSEGN